MLVGIDHIGIAVRNLDEAIRVYVDALGAETSKTHRFSEAQMQVSMLSVGGTTIELMSPVGAEGIIAKFIQRHGEGIHHICFEVDDIDKELSRLSAKGVKLIDEIARPGLDGMVAFIHPKAMNGVLIELVQKTQSSTFNKTEAK